MYVNPSQRTEVKIPAQSTFAESDCGTCVSPIATSSRRRRRQTETTMDLNKTVSLLAILSLFLACPAASFQVAATKTHGGSSESRTTRLSVSSALIAPPAHHLEWLRSLEDKSNHHANLLQQSTWLPGDFSWLVGESDGEGDEVPLDVASSFNDTSAKDVWAARYASVEALRKTFGRNRNVLWGDLDPVSTRRLYKTLLPRALLELYHCHGASSEDLAPLAYRARVAAKLYARERSTLPTRLGACLFDGVRQFRKYGSFQMTGMSYDQIWEKYAKQVMQEGEWEDEEDLTSKICYKILEKSCTSNAAVDSMLLGEDAHDLKEITRKLEKEVFDLLHDDEAAKQWAIRRYKTLKTLLRIRRRLEHVRHPEDHHHHDHHQHHNHHNNHKHQHRPQNLPEFATSNQNI